MHHVHLRAHAFHYYLRGQVKSKGLLANSSPRP
jgi:hypothetical protein